MNDEASRSDVPRQGGRKPYRVRLPGFVSEEDVGLGDAIKRATSTVGISLAAAADAGLRRSTAGWFSPADTRGRWRLK